MVVWDFWTITSINTKIPLSQFHHWIPLGWPHMSNPPKKWQASEVPNSSGSSGGRTGASTREEQQEKQQSPEEYSTLSTLRIQFPLLDEFILALRLSQKPGSETTKKNGFHISPLPKVLPTPPVGPPKNATHNFPQRPCCQGQGTGSWCCSSKG